MKTVRLDYDNALETRVLRFEDWVFIQITRFNLDNYTVDVSVKESNGVRSADSSGIKTLGAATLMVEQIIEDMGYVIDRTPLDPVSAEPPTEPVVDKPARKPRKAKAI